MTRTCLRRASKTAGPPCTGVCWLGSNHAEKEIKVVSEGSDSQSIENVETIYMQKEEMNPALT